MARLSKKDLLEKIEEAIEENVWNLTFTGASTEHPFQVKIFRGTETYTLRIYIWNLTHGGGAARPTDEYRIQITGIDHFIQEPGERTLILGWWEEGEVFVGFDFAKHTGKLGSSPSMQIKREYLERASQGAVIPYDKGNGEIVVAFSPEFFAEYVQSLDDLHQGENESLENIDAGRLKAIDFIERARVANATQLNLSNLGLRELPRELLNLKEHLTELTLGQISDDETRKNRIKDFTLLQEFAGLRKLRLTGLKMPSLDPLDSLSQLKELDLSHTDIVDTDAIDQLIQLRKLSLEGTTLDHIGGKAILPNLDELLLDSNESFNPDSLSADRFPHLRVLGLTFNPYIEQKMYSLVSFGNLESLFLNNTGISDLSIFSRFPRLKLLRLENNQISDIQAIADLTDLRWLDLRGNQVQDIGPLSKLIQLRSLTLDNNQITDLTPLNKLTSLNFLSLEQNQIKDLTPLTDLIALRNLFLSSNKIDDISALSDLPKLEWIYVSENNISDILPLKKWLQQKKKVAISFENVTQGFQANRLSLSGNPITNPPVQYLNAGKKAILAYWDQQDKIDAGKRKVETVNEAKLIIVGNSHVGKSTLSYQLQHGKLPSANLPSTHGLEFGTWKPGWTIDGKELTINIIDFGGQEYYHDTHHLFFNDKAVFLLLWDPETNRNFMMETPVGHRKRLERIRHFNVEYWLNAIAIYGGTIKSAELFRFKIGDWRSSENFLFDGKTFIEPPTLLEDTPSYELFNAKTLHNAPVLLVQTFMDKRGKSFLNMRDLQSRYSRLNDALSISMEMAENTTRGIDFLQAKLKTLYEEVLSDQVQTYDVSWIAIRKYIEQEEKTQVQIMNIAEFRDYFLLHTGMKKDYSEEDVRIMCITLNYWGVVLYRYEMEDLQDIVIINPQHFTTQINNLLTEKLREKNGAITKQDVLKVLKMDPKKTEDFLKVLTSFKILFELPRATEDNEPYYISPMYLQEKPAYVDLFLTQFVSYYVIKYDGYFHKGILLDCFKELGKDLLYEKQLYFYWQWGLVLRRNERVICIEFDDTHLNQILIKTIRKDKEALGRDPFLQEIFAAFNRINQKYKVDIELSCDGTNFISKKTILDKMKSGLNKFDHDGKRLDIRDFSFLLGPGEIPSTFKRVFVSYSSKDRTSLDTLESHLKLYQAAGVITYWDDLFLNETAGWDQQITEEMEKANILIMLLSPDYLGTEYIIKREIPIALDHLRAPLKTKQVFWVWLRPCNYEAYPEIAQYPIYPLKEKEIGSDRASQRAISEYDNQDRQWDRLLKRILIDT